VKYLIVGLGNIGSEYENTRHNIGFMVLDELAKTKEASFKQDRHAFVTEVKHKGRTLVLVKPTTYMNLSGKAVRYWMKELNIPLENVLVITDDLDLPFGKLRMKAKGSGGSHNGMNNIIEILGRNDFPRLRFGIGNDYSRGKQVDYVLGEFDKDELPALPERIDMCIKIIEGFATIGTARSMSAYNNK